MEGAQPVSLSVPELIRSVQSFLPTEKHDQLNDMLARYMRKELGKPEVRATRAWRAPRARAGSGPQPGPWRARAARMARACTARAFGRLCSHANAHAAPLLTA